MSRTLTATEAVRHFSEILNSIKYRGEEYTIIRNGRPVAVLSPVKLFPKERVLGELSSLIKNLPRLDDEAERFEEALKEIREKQPTLPEKKEWV
jgi:prevent-host-death family protein